MFGFSVSSLDQINFHFESYTAYSSYNEILSESSS